MWKMLNYNLISLPIVLHLLPVFILHYVCIFPIFILLHIVQKCNKESSWLHAELFFLVLFVYLNEEISNKVLIW